MKRQNSSKAVFERERRFTAVVEVFATDPSVTLGKEKGFGAGALRVNDKIFAMISATTGAFVVKLPKKRVDELVEAGSGERFNPTRRKPMKEWIEISDQDLDWVRLGKEAYDFVRG